VATRDSSDSPYVSEDQYRDESDLKKYRTEIPNMIFDIGLTLRTPQAGVRSRKGRQVLEERQHALKRNGHVRRARVGSEGRTRPTRPHPHEAAEGAGDRHYRNNRGHLASEHGAVFG
jgi:hypothetical protein